MIPTQRLVRQPTRRWRSWRHTSRASERTSHSYRLVAALHIDIDQERRAVLERLADQVGGILHGLGALAFDAERTGEADEIDRRIVELHADEFVSLLGEAAQHDQALLEDAVAGVVED